MNRCRQRKLHTALTFLCLLAGLPAVAPECFLADIAIVVDVSESTRILNLTTDQFQFGPDYGTFIGDFLTYLDPLSNRVGLVAYSTSATIENALTSNLSEVTSSLSTLVSRAQFAKQNTDTGISLATDLLVTTGRPDVPRYILVFLDGLSRDTSRTTGALVTASEANITVISVSVRGFLQEGPHIAGRTFRHFSVASASELASRRDIAEKIAGIVCTECKGYSDVVYLLDGSDSTRRISADFTSIVYAGGVVDLIKNVTSRLAMGPVRESIISFSMTPQVVTAMTGNATAINVGVDSMRPEFSSTEAGQAFRKAREVLENASPPRPADVPRYIIYLVDGAVSNDTDLAAQALITRNMGIEVYAAGFSPAAKFNDLFIATGAVDRIRQVNSDRDLDQFVDPLAYYLCQTAPALIQTPV